MQSLISLPGVNSSCNKNHPNNWNNFGGSKAKANVFDITWKFLFMLRMCSKSDTFPVLIDACFLKIFGTFYPIWAVLDTFSEISNNKKSNISPIYEQETTVTFIFETPCRNAHTNACVGEGGQRRSQYFYRKKVWTCVQGDLVQSSFCKKGCFRGPWRA